MTLVTAPKKTTKPGHKHTPVRGHSRRYLKPYWPYIPIALIVGLGFMQLQHQGAKGTVLGESADYSPVSLVNDTNTQRQANGLPALVENTELDAAARASAEKMVVQNYWSHVSPSGETPWDYIAASGYSYAYAGENLAYGFSNSSQTLAGWMASPEHRANILGTHYTDIGIGIVPASNYLGKGPAMVVVALYAEPQAAVSSVAFIVPSQADQTTVRNQQAATTQPPSINVSHFSLLLGGQSAWVVPVVTFLAGCMVVIVLVRHGRRWYRQIIKGEQFILHHPLFDIGLVGLSVTIVVLRSTTGFIR